MNNLVIPTNNKAHTDSNGMDFWGLIAGYAPANDEQLQRHQTASILAQILPADKLRFITTDIVVNGQDLPTAGAIGVILTNPHGQASNMAILPAGNGEPFLLHGFDNDALIIGAGGEFIATDNLDKAIDLKVNIGLDDDRYTIITPLQQWQFNSLVKAHAKQHQVMLLANYSQGKEYEREFKGDNVKVIATVDSIADLLMEYSIDDIISNKGNDPRLQTKVTQLNGIEWGEPEPLADDTTPATRYPIEAWAGVLGEAVKAIAHHAQVPQAMAGQCVLGALSTIGQRYINAPIGHDYMPASLYLITEGGTGSGKTRANKLSHRSIMLWEEKAYKQFISGLKEWEADRNALKGAERLQYEATTPKPKNNNMLVKDATIESILDRFIIDEIPNQSWTTSEAGQFLNGHSMKSDTAGNALASLTSVWSGESVSRLRSQRGNNPQYKTNAYDVRFTLDLQGQRVILEPALSDPLMNEQGFLPRCLIACPDSLQGYRVWNTPERMNQSPHDDPRLQAYWARCEILLDPLPTEIQLDNEGKEVRKNLPFADKGAMQALADFQQVIENQQATGNALEFLRGYASRMAENASRIASLMAFFDCQKAVSTDYLERAFKLVEYSTAERLRYLDIKPAGKNDSQKLLDWLIAKAGKMNPPKLNRTYVANNCPNPMQRSNKLLQQELDRLEQAGYIHQEQEGRKKVIYLNPCLFK